MTPTDILRVMLDERGIEYETPTSTSTVTHIGDIKYRFLQYRRCGEPELDEKLDGKMFVETEWLTPEQAIAATAGAGTCHMRLLENMHTSAYQDMYECDQCGEQVLRETYMGKSEPPNFCPNCGRKVVSE